MVPNLVYRAPSWFYKGAEIKSFVEEYVAIANNSNVAKITATSGKHIFLLSANISIPATKYLYFRGQTLATREILTSGAGEETILEYFNAPLYIGTTLNYYQNSGAPVVMASRIQYIELRIS